MFLIFRQQMSTIQGVLAYEEGVVSETMVQWAEHLHHESIVLVEGVLQKPKDGQEEVKSASIHQLEVKIEKVDPPSSLSFHGNTKNSARCMLLLSQPSHCPSK